MSLSDPISRTDGAGPGNQLSEHLAAAAAAGRWSLVAGLGAGRVAGRWLRRWVTMNHQQPSALGWVWAITFRFDVES